MFLRRLNTIHYITNNLNKKSMKKKEYERPTMQVVKLKQQPQLLAGSVDPVDPFTPGGDPLTPEP